MSLRGRTTKNVRRTAALHSDTEILEYTGIMIAAGVSASYIIEMTGLSKHTVDSLIDRDRGARTPGRRKGALTVFQDDAKLRLYVSVFLHAYTLANQSESWSDPGAFVRALRALDARAPGHEVDPDLLCFALKQIEKGEFALARCPGCATHFLKIQPKAGVKRTLEGDCFICNYRFKALGRSSSIAGKELLALAKQP